MTARKTPKSKVSVGDFCATMQAIADPALAQSWDNVGLLAGDINCKAHRILACIDLTPPVVDEAIQGKFDLVLAYHPPIFKPISSLRADSTETDSMVFDCIRAGIAIYATHTALDAADGGTNDVIAELCGIHHTEPLEYVDAPGVDQRKVVVTVPSKQVDEVAAAMFQAGAGHIGEYSHCSFRNPVQGTFWGSDSTNPALGKRGGLEYVDELRLETVVPANCLPGVIAALIQAHPYEEPAFDIYPLQPKPVRGIGRVGELLKPVTLASLGRSLKKKTRAKCVQIVGAPDQEIRRATIVVGAAGNLPFRNHLDSHDVIITGEIRHHDALTIERRGCSAIALGHWTSEHPVLARLAKRIEDLAPGTTVAISKSDHEPFTPV